MHSKHNLVLKHIVILKLIVFLTEQLFQDEYYSSICFLLHGLNGACHFLFFARLLSRLVTLESFYQILLLITF